jgi:Fe-S-cluster containining protein
MPGYDCQTCGVCCLDPFGQDSYVGLSCAEGDRMGRLGLRVIVTGKRGLELAALPRPGVDGTSACVALAGEVGKVCSCSIYPDRPGQCRAFEPGSVACRVARVQAGLSPYP